MSSQLSTRIQFIIESLRNQCHRDSTKRNYYKVWKLFNEFILKLDRKPRKWEHRLILFIGHLIDSNKQSTTVKSYISAIRAVLKTNQIDIAEDQFLITSLTKACRLKNDCVKTRLPITKDLLAALLKQTNKFYKNKGQRYLRVLYQAILSTAYYGLFRVGELTSGSHPVLARKVFIASNKKKFSFVLETSKTHWKNNKPQTIKISSQKYKKGTKNNLKLPCLY